MSYEVLARKWRPRKFAELVGQEHVVRALSHALDHGRLHHAYLFTGTRGVGKTSIARIFAKSLNCEQGASANPCGKCAVCVAVDAGRFVDLLEIDAASHTGVDDVREMIESAQYAPSHGRFKVYLIDEVHMLSRPAFNALLKTLEEPPPHVKFLLATTDPQKLPVTVLSRCLKFNLKRLLPEQISRQMQHIMKIENIEYEEVAINELAKAADGSLRDALSLLDQAVAHGGGALKTSDVRSMLGHVGRERVLGLLAALADGDGTRLLDECECIASYSPNFATVLDELASMLHQIQLIQLLPDFPSEEGDAAQRSLSERLLPEDVQLYYQIATQGGRDLELAPDVRTGFDMTLLRMLAFRPVTEAGSIGVDQTHENKARPLPVDGRLAQQANDHQTNVYSAASTAEGLPTETSAATISRLSPCRSSSALPDQKSSLPDWAAMIRQAGLRGPVGELAQNLSLREYHEDTWIFALQPVHKHLEVEPARSQLTEYLTQECGKTQQLRIVSDEARRMPTPAECAAEVRCAAQSTAQRAITDDPVVQSIIRDFAARVVPDSIEPVKH